jgi:ribosomal protein L31E
MKRSQGPRCITRISRLKKDEQRLKTWEDYTFWRNVTAVAWGSQGVSFIKFLIGQRTINASYYSKLLRDRIKAASRSKRRDRSVKSVCLLHDKARPHTAVVTTGTLEQMHWEVLPHPVYSPDPAPRDFKLFGSLKEAQGEKRFRADSEVKLSVQWWLDEQPQTLFERGIMKAPEQWRICIGVYKECAEK